MDLAARACPAARLTVLQSHPARAARLQAFSQQAGPAKRPGPPPVRPSAELPLCASNQSSNVVPLKRSRGRTQPSSWLEPALQTAAAPLRARILQVQSAAELSHLYQCHTNRLLVLHFATPGCKLHEAFCPSLQQCCDQHPEALFLAIAVQPGEVAAAASPATLAAGAALPEPSPGSAAERLELLQGLCITALPCTLLVRGGQLLDRLQIESSVTGTDNGSSVAVAEAAAAAAVRLHAAMQAALQQMAGA